MENTSVLIYLLKSTVAFTALYGLYLLLFRKNQHFLIGRFYLVFTIVFASLFPFIKFITYKTVEIPAFETAIPKITGIGQKITAKEPNISTWILNNISNVTFYIYLIVSSLILVRLLYMLIRFGLKLLKHSRVEKLYGKKVIVSDYWNQTFSFFGIIVLPQKDFLLKENHLLIQHELVHVRQYHTLDLLLAELFQVLHWFNPFAHFIKKDMREVHEFLADFNVVKDGTSKYAYQQLLLNYLANSVTPRVANSFSAKLLKKRFAMMTTNKTPKSTLIKYSLAIPVIAILIGLMSFQTIVKYSYVSTKNNDKIEPTNSCRSNLMKGQGTDDLESKLLNVINANKGTYLKNFLINSETLPLILKQGVTYRFYLVWSDQRSNLKNDIVLTRENENKIKEPIKAIKTFKGKDYSYFDYFCEKTGAYEFGITDFEQDINYVAGLCMLSIDETHTSKTEVIDQNSTNKQDTSKKMDDVFVVVDEMPKFDNKGLEAARDYIAKNMKYPDTAIEKGIQGQVFVTFIVEKDGSVSNTKIERGVDPILDKEAIRAVESMPKWTPGYQNGKAARVKFTIPATFILNENKLQNSKSKNTAVILVENYEPFVVVEKMPKFDNKDDISVVSNYIAQNIRYPAIAKEKGTQGKVYVSFVVEEDGSISTTKIERGVDPILDKEAIRVIESMPKWTPGYQRGQAVRVKFTLPVVFKLNDKK